MHSNGAGGNIMCPPRGCEDVRRPGRLSDAGKWRHDTEASLTGWYHDEPQYDAVGLLESSEAGNGAQALSPMNNDIDRRLTELEIKASFSEDLVDQLNQVIVRQQQQIDLLLREVARLRDQAPADVPGPFRSLRDELPPHY